MTTSNFFVPFTFSGQRDDVSEGLFPLALQVKDSAPTLESSVSALETMAKSGELSSLLHSHGGALLIRGFPIETPQDYSDVLAKNVKTANEGPPEMPIWPHNEYGWSTINPAWLIFSCLTVPETGGETPLISSLALATYVETHLPTFYQALLKKGVRYIYRYSKETNSQSNTGASVTAAYRSEVREWDDEETVKRKIEREVQRHSWRWEWHEDGGLSVVHVVPLIRKHLESGRTTFFGNLTNAYGRSKYHGATEPPFLGGGGGGGGGGYHPLPTYGDGSPIPTQYLEKALAAAEDLQVLVKWEAGDIVLLDNYSVMHSRRPWTGERKVLAALWDQDGRIGDFREGLEILKGAPRIPIETK
ncbi:Clavaminate synthase-like protein [Acephala macrosclerotiorum]|nr:Clavaminate synthase-like protein [Acephala macrosclerotiorum]